MTTASNEEAKERTPLPPLLQAIEAPLAGLRVQLDDLVRTQQVYSDCLAPALQRLAADLQQQHRQHAQEQLQQRAEQLNQEKTQWEDVDEPAARTALAAAETELAKVQQQALEVEKAHAELTATISELAAVEALHPPDAAPSSFASLPVSALCCTMRFLRPADLAHLSQVSATWRRQLDRGALWRGLCVRAVTQIVSAQRAAQQAAATKRRALGGLSDDFHSANFLACAAATNGGSALSPTADSNASPPPPAQHCQVQISFTQAAMRGSGSKSAGSSSIASLPKAEVFAAALRALQRTVDPALSEFEDQSLKQSAHQRTVGFLQAQRDDARHRLGQASGALGEDLRQLALGTRRKDELAAQIQQLEAELAAEQRVGRAAQDVERAHERAQTKQANLRRHLDALVSESLSAEELAAERARAEQAEALECAQADELAASLLVLKQQKKVLSKAAKSLAAEIEEAAAEKIEWQEKLARLRAQVQTIRV